MSDNCGAYSPAFMESSAIPEQLTDEMGKWAVEAKKRKLIRFFGFSTHLQCTPARCPQRLPISELVAEAVSKLA